MSKEKIITVLECTNPNCGYRWVPRVEHPKHCPKCMCWLKWPEEEASH